MVGVYARVQRVVSNMRKAKKRVGRELLPEERRDAEKDIIRSAQGESFQEEHKSLPAKKQVAQKRVLVKLNPRLDDQGMIRSDGRLRFEEYLPYDARFPFVLPKGHWITRLIVRYFHELANHSAGINFFLMQISQRYWLPAARDEIKDFKNQCNECKKTEKQDRSTSYGPSTAKPSSPHISCCRPNRSRLCWTYHHNPRTG